MADSVSDSVEFIHLEDLIRAGRLEEVRAIVRHANPTKASADHRLRFAKICRRVGLPSLGLRFLTPPGLESREKWLASAARPEVAEYAILLQRIGSVPQALKILHGLEAAGLPEIWLYQAFCHFNRWNYAESIAPLQTYIQSPISDYQKLVGRVNLAAAWIAIGEIDLAEALLTPLFASTREQGHVRLLANLHELMSQICIERGELDEARRALDEAAQILGATQTLDQLFIRKGQAILDSFKSLDPRPLLDFKVEAERRRDWELVREADFQLVKLQFDQRRFEKMIFGTPFRSYRERARREFAQAPLQDVYLHGDPAAALFDLQSGEWGSKNVLRVGGKVHQLLEILLRDFYSPMSLGMLFAELFPDEYFDAYSSPVRVHQILSRFRNWAREFSLPIELEERDQLYALKLTGAICFNCKLERPSAEWHEIQLRRMEESVAARWPVSARELQEILGLETAPFRRFTNWALRNEKIERSGAGPATRYACRVKMAA